MEIKTTLQEVNSSPTVWKVIAVVSLLITLSFGAYTAYREINLNKLENNAATKAYAQFQPFVERVQKDSTQLVEQSQLLASKDAQIVKQIEKIEHLKSLNSQVVAKTVTEIKDVKIPFIDSAKVITKVDSSTKDSTQYLQVPARAQIITPHFQIDETVMVDGIEVNHIIIPDSTTNTIGDKGNLFKDEPVVFIHHSNPFIKTIDMKNIVVKPKLSKGAQGFVIGVPVGAAATVVVAILVKLAASGWKF